MHEKCSTSLAIWEMQSKLHWRFHLTPVNMVIGKQKATNVGKDTGRRNPYTLMVGCKLVQKP
jgi:hypothetical protein